MDEDYTKGVQVPAEGPRDARIVLVGEAPGADEIKQGRPFVGKAGELLDRLLSDIGLERRLCYITNVCKVRPPGNKFSYFRSKECKGYLKQSIETLRAEIREVNPNVVVCLGAEPARALLRDGRVKARRGFVEWSEELGCKLIVTYHPAAVLRMINLYPVILFDLKKAKSESETATHIQVERNALTTPSLEEVVLSLERIRKVGKRCTFDIETTSEGIDCIGIANSPTESIVVPFTVQTEKSITTTMTNSEGVEESWEVMEPVISNYWSQEDEVRVWGLIKLLLEDSSVEKCAQNAFFDMWHLQTQLGIRANNVSFDTMLAAALLNAEFAKDLWFLAAQYCGNISFWEDEDDTLGVGRWKYCGMDAMVTFELWEKQAKELDEYGLRDFFNRLPMSLLPCLVRTSQRGVSFDSVRRTDLLKEATGRLRGEVKSLRALTGPEFNYRSHKQKCEYFIKGKRLKPIIDRGSKSPTFSSEALEKLDKKYRLPELRHLIDISKFEHEVNVLRVKVSKDGRLRCSYNIAGTETGRLSSSEAPDRTGANLQNIAEEYRVLVKADPGCVLLKADLQQAENRMVAYLSRDFFMIEIVESGGDIHRRIASMIFKKAEGDISDHERQLGKKIGHASNYGMGPRRFCEVAWEEDRLEISTGEARKLQEDYFNAFPGIRRWQVHVQSLLSQHRVLTNPFGRVRRFLGHWGPSLFKEGYAYLPQSSIADCVNTSLIELDTQGLDIRLQTHDEIVFNIKKEEVQAQAKEIKKVMETPFKVGDNTVSIPVELKWGLNWKETEPLEVLDDSRIEGEVLS